MKSDCKIIFTQTVQAGPMTTLRPVGATIPLKGVVDQDGTSRLTGVTVQDYDNAKAAMTLLFFSDKLTTDAVDDTAWTMHANDMAHCLGKVEIATTDYTTVGGKAVATKNLPQPLVLLSTTMIVYVVAIVTGTPTYASATVGFAFDILK